MTSEHFQHTSPSYPAKYYLLNFDQHCGNEVGFLSSVNDPHKGVDPSPGKLHEIHMIPIYI